MKKIVRIAAALTSVVMNRSMEIVQPMYTQSNDVAQVKYIVRRLNRGAVRAKAVPETNPQQAIPMLILDLVTLSVMPTISSKSLR
ncbi:unnamed protein product [Aspergillus oryzae]|nr:unnamed protein product [Aspergillus oryzae]